MDEPRINIILADDHELFRDGLKALLKRTTLIREIWDASNGRETIDLLKEHPECDLVLLDIEMPVMNGCETARFIRKEFPEVKIVILSMFFNDELIFEMFENDVNGYLLKNTSLQELKKALALIRDGAEYFCPAVSNILFKNLLRKNKNNPVLSLNLSEREKEILLLVCRQFTNDEISQKLYISENTVKTHRRSIMEKTGSRNSAGLVTYALRWNLITLEDL